MAGYKVTSAASVETPTRTVRIALVGNPNTGKTTLFNALAGMRQHVGNYPGVTVDIKIGRMRVEGKTLEIVDLPGTYSLAARSPDEMLAVDLILGQQPGETRPDAVVSIVDASNLERNLYLTTQLLELGVPVVVALNMVDVAKVHGISIDAARLSQQLGVPVVPIRANKGVGLAELRRTIEEAVGGLPPANTVTFPEALHAEVFQLEAAVDSPAVILRRALIDAGGVAEARLVRQHPPLRAMLLAARERLAAAGCKLPDVEAQTRYAWIRKVTTGCISRPDKRPITWTDRLDAVLTHRVWGTLTFLIIMFLVFQSIFTWAKPLMEWVDLARGNIAALVGGWLSPGPLRGLIVDGVIKGVGSVLVFLPQILILFGFIAILEDCGYMARAAFLMDRIMASCGLSGKSFIPMLSSVACAIPGIMATRVIEDRRDRLTTILVAPLMSCSARLPVYVLLIGAFLTAGYPIWLPGVVMFGLYSLGIVLAPLVALLLKRTLLRGETPTFIMEMPGYKWPALSTVFRRMADSTWAFVRRAGTLILACMIVVWALLYFPHTDSTGVSYDVLIDEKSQSIEDRVKVIDELKSAPDDPAAQARIAELTLAVEPVQQEINVLQAEWKSQSILGRAGKALEPIFVPLGWDWRVGMAALASFPAREVVVGTLSLIYQVGETDAEEAPSGETRLAHALQAATWDGEPDRKVFTVPVALSLMVFFALCCQCASTLAVMKRETNSWRWPAFAFVYMTTLAYIAAFLVYQVGSRIA